MTAANVSERVWQQQDPAAARLSLHTRGRLLVLASVAMVMALGLPQAQRAGAFQPQLGTDDTGWNGVFIDPSGHTDFAMHGGAVSSDVSGTMTVKNTGSTTVRVLAVTLAGPGFTFDHATIGDTHVDGNTVHPGGETLTAAERVSLAPGASLDLTLFFTITDCHAVASGPQFATIRIDSWRGVQTASLAVPTVRHNDGGWSVTSPVDPHGISSVRYLADAVCNIDMNPT